MSYLNDNEIRWIVWSGVLYCLNNASIKKDKEDNADTLYNSFYPEFKKQILEAPMIVVVKLGQSILAAGENEKKSFTLFSNKVSFFFIIHLSVRNANFDEL